MDKTTPMKAKPLVDVTCKLGVKGCFEDGRCHALGNCENKIKTNADRIRSMTDKQMSTDLIPMIMEICEDGVPSEELFLEWLQSEAE